MDGLNEVADKTQSFAAPSSASGSANLLYWRRGLSPEANKKPRAPVTTANAAEACATATTCWSATFAQSLQVRPVGAASGARCMRLPKCSVGGDAELVLKRKEGAIEKWDLHFLNTQHPFKSLHPIGVDCRMQRAHTKQLQALKHFMRAACKPCFSSTCFRQCSAVGPLRPILRLRRTLLSAFADVVFFLVAATLAARTAPRVQCREGVRGRRRRVTVARCVHQAPAAKTQAHLQLRAKRG